MSRRWNIGVNWSTFYFGISHCKVAWDFWFGPIVVWRLHKKDETT